MFVFCAGMYRSGSTWQYQVAVEIGRSTGRTVHAIGHRSQADVAAVYEAADPSAITVLKTHDALPEMEGVLRAPNVRVLYSFRDLRDVVFSMRHKTSSSFANIVGNWKVIENSRAAEAFWLSLARHTEQCYESWVLNPIPDLFAIADCLDVPLNLAQARELRDRFSLEKQKRRTDRFADALRDEGVDLADPGNALRYDRSTLLHWNHIRQGTVGDWRRQATDDQKQILADLCGDWLIARSYEKDFAWAHSQRLAG